ncbi:MAG: tetratricopeptide repeat protein [Myxococcota bacterium]
MRVHSWVLLVGVVLSSHVALAQEVEQARAEFRQGVEHARAENWAEAEAAFRRAYARYPDPIIVFNLAAAQAQLGRFRDARDSYREFLERATEEHEGSREAAETELARVSAQIGSIRLEIHGAEDGDVVTVDERVVEPAGLIEADPGMHVVAVQRGSARVARQEVNVSPGETARAELAIVNPERVVVVEQSAGRNRALIGAVVGIVAALAVGAVVLGIVLRPDSEEAFEGNVPPGVLSVPLGRP